eukprot:11494864-Prorocentrum_lima.AAC.1
MGHGRARCRGKCFQQHGGLQNSLHAAITDAGPPRVEDCLRTRGSAADGEEKVTDHALAEARQ